MGNNYINGQSIDQIIKCLNKAIPLIESTKEMVKSDHSYYDANGNAMIAALSKHVDDIIGAVIRLKSINKNTVYPVNFIDAFAMKEALEEYGNPIESVDILPMWHDSNEEPDDANPDYFIMVIHYSRYSLNPIGYHNGYENVTFEWKLYFKKELGLSGIPYNLSHLVCLPELSTIEIVNKSLPDEEFPNIDSHEPDCDIFKRDLAFPWNPDNDPFPNDCTCGLNDEWEGYSHPDDDFFYQEIENIIHLILMNNLIPEAKFDATKSEWTLGDQSYVVGQPMDEWWLG